MMEIDKTAQKITLKDGRRLGYAEVGDLNGKPVFHFHGYVGSRLEALLVEDLATQNEVHLIAIDRPGMGLSDFKANRSLLDWPDDVVELADALGIEQFVVEGISGGGPYAAACAYKIPDRLTACGIIAGLGPLDLKTKGMMKKNQLLFFLARRLPWVYGFLIWLMMGRQVTNIEKSKKLLQKGVKNLPEPDRMLFLNPRFQDFFALELAEGFRQGSKGPAYDGILYTKPWNFKLEDISPEIPVYLWHGELDVNVPISMGRAMCSAIPNCKGKFYPNEGHLSVAFNNLEDIFKTLVP
ncbi:MAG: alpha/beta fold hydrolase [Candidatus Hodarchaeales archaeon]